jgi:sec-independent protein translocase protein TatB
MFGIGFIEITIIIAIALVVIGPEKLPDMMKVVGKTFGEFKRAAEDVRKSMSDVQDNVTKEVSEVEESFSLEDKSGEDKDGEDKDGEKDEEKKLKKEKEKDDDGDRKRS